MSKFFNKFSIFNFQFSISSGQTLIEALAALAIVGIVISAIGVIVTTSLSNARFDENQTLATKYAQQGSEVIQQIRDDNYTGFQNFNGTYCLGQGQITLGLPANCTSANMDNTFIRSITIQQNGCGANIAQVTVNVSFTDSKCANGKYCHIQTISTCLSTVNSVQAP